MRANVTLLPPHHTPAIVELQLFSSGTDSSQGLHFEMEMGDPIILNSFVWWVGDSQLEALYGAASNCPTMAPVTFDEVPKLERQKII